MIGKNQSFAPADAEKQVSLWREFLAMLSQHKKFWLAPIVIALLLFGLLIVLGSSAAAPFIYPLF